MFPIHTIVHSPCHSARVLAFSLNYQTECAQCAPPLATALAHHHHTFTYTYPALTFHSLTLITYHPLSLS